MWQAKGYSRKTDSMFTPSSYHYIIYQKKIWKHWALRQKSSDKVISKEVEKEDEEFGTIHYKYNSLQWR
jgi:hypothetical protein